MGNLGYIIIVIGAALILFGLLLRTQLIIRVIALILGVMLVIVPTLDKIGVIRISYGGDNGFSVELRSGEDEGEVVQIDPSPTPPEEIISPETVLPPSPSEEGRHETRDFNAETLTESPPEDNIESKVPGELSSGFEKINSSNRSSSIPVPGYKYAVIKKGAFLFSEGLNITRYAQGAHGLINYLPVGTVVFYKPELPPQPLRTLRGSPRFYEIENYITVESETGVSGLVEETLMMDLVDVPILITTSNKQIPVFSRNSSEDKFKKINVSGLEDFNKSIPPNPSDSIEYGKLAKTFWEKEELISNSIFSRSSFSYVEVVGESSEFYYDVVLPWTRKGNGSHVDKGKIPKAWVYKGGPLRYLSNNPENLSKNMESLPEMPPRLKMQKISFIKDHLQDQQQKILGFIQKKFPGSDPGKLKATFTGLESLKCTFNLNGDVEVAGKIFGTGFGFSSAFLLKEKSRFYQLAYGAYSKKNLKHKEFTLVKDIRCKNNRPDRMVDFMIQEGSMDDKKKAFIALDALLNKFKRQKEWNYLLEDEDIHMKMVNIDGYDTYIKYFDFMDEVSKYEGYLSTLPMDERKVILTLILSEIAHFSQTANVLQNIRLDKRIH